MASSSESHGTHDINDKLWAAARSPMTPEQEREQRISFVYGNVGMSNASVTRKMVEDVVDGKNQVIALNPTTETQAIAKNPRIGDWIQTFTGAQAYPMDLRPSEINIEDIAHSLSMQCRYTGHCLRFYSVAEHSVLMARHFQRAGLAEYALPALLHDATEAYLCDVPRPVKPFLPGYKEAEARAWLAIAERFSMDRLLSSHVHAADARILVDERAQNMAPSAVEWDNMPGHGLGVTLRFWTPRVAREEFMSVYWSIIETGRH